MTLGWLADALDEAGNAAEFYEERVTGLGARFLDELRATLDSIIAFPHAGSRVADVLLELECRRRLLPSFPIEVDYLVAGDRITIAAVSHNARSPGYWLSRLRR